MKRRITLSIRHENDGILTIIIISHDNDDLKNAANLGKKYGHLGEITEVSVEEIGEDEDALS